MVPATEFEDLERTLEDRRQRVEAALRRLVAPGRAPVVEAAGADSLFAPAKRLRPILSLLVAEVLNGNPEAVLPEVERSALVLKDGQLRLGDRIFTGLMLEHYPEGLLKSRSVISNGGSSVACFSC